MRIAECNDPTSLAEPLALSERNGLERAPPPVDFQDSQITSRIGRVDARIRFARTVRRALARKPDQNSSRSAHHMVIGQHKTLFTVDDDSAAEIVRRRIPIIEVVGFAIGHPPESRDHVEP